MTDPTRDSISEPKATSNPLPSTPSPKTPPSEYLGKDSPKKYENHPKQCPKASYTNFIVDPKTGCWSCPECAARTNRPYAMKLRGYKKASLIIKAIEKSTGAASVEVPECYRDFQNKYWFQNPARVTKCQNGWIATTRDVEACTFDREEVEKFRDEKMEEECDEWSRSKEMGWLCGPCGIVYSEEWKEKNPERWEYIWASFNDLSTPWTYRAHAERIFCIGPSFHRLNRYDGTMESLTCATKKWGLGDKLGSENTPCSGRYGGPMSWWKLIKGRDGEEYRWIEEDWIPPPENEDDDDHADLNAPWLQWYATRDSDDSSLYV